jgi:hypothetical protein
MNCLRCLLCAQFAASFAGGDIIGSACVAHRHNEFPAVGNAKHLFPLPGKQPEFASRRALLNVQSSMAEADGREGAVRTT